MLQLKNVRPYMFVPVSNPLIHLDDIPRVIFSCMNYFVSFDISYCDSKWLLHYQVDICTIILQFIILNKSGIILYVLTLNIYIFIYDIN